MNSKILVVCKQESFETLNSSIILKLDIINMTAKDIQKDLEILQESLNGLCSNLRIFLRETEKNVFQVKQQYNQIKITLEPWTVKRKVSKELKCSCSNKNVRDVIKKIQNEDEVLLLESITKTLSNAALIRSKSKSTITPKTTDLKTKKSRDSTEIRVSSFSRLQGSSSLNKIEHTPSCPLYENDSTSKTHILKLSEAISVINIPLELSQTVKKCNTFFQTCETGAGKYLDKDNFLHILQKRSRHTCSEFIKTYPKSDKLMKYITVLNNNQNTMPKNEMSWILYKDVQQLDQYTKNNLFLSKKQSWNHILNYVIRNIIPNTDLSKLDDKEKIYLFKILKSICNYSSSDLPSVPLFRIYLE